MVATAARRPLLPILVALSGAHLLNDLIQSMIPAMYPLLKEAYMLDFAQIGLITLAFQVTASLLQPVLGLVTDHKPWPYAMVAGMGATLSGLLGLSFAGSYPMILVSVAMIGLGSAVFHPEATRMARHAAAGQQGFAQGIFQIGGHAGYAMGPLLAALIVVPRGQSSLAWASVVALVAMVLMTWTAGRYAEMRRAQMAAAKEQASSAADEPIATSRRVFFAMAILIVLLLSKNGYTAAFTSYYTFFLIERFGVSVQLSQIMLFLYLVVGALGRDHRRHDRRPVRTPPRDLDIHPRARCRSRCCCRMRTCSGPACSACSSAWSWRARSRRSSSMPSTWCRIAWVSLAGCSTAWHSGSAGWRPRGWACWPIRSASSRCSSSSPGCRRWAC